MRVMRVIWLVLLPVAAACGKGGSEAVVAGETQELAADRVLYGTRFNTTVDGIRRAVQQSDSMYVYEDSASARMFGVHVMMYDTLGRKTADIRSLGGQVNQRTQKMVAQGNVVLVLADGARVETEELSYDPETHRIWSEVETKYRWPDGSVTTYGTFTVDDQFRNPSGTNARGRIPGLRL